MERARVRIESAAWWALPPLVALWYYRLALRTWFFGDDFAWLKHATEFSNFGELLHAIFMPMAQGTIRPWSDRVFFIVFYRLFGLDPLPFHICIFLTQWANLLLLAAIARRLTGSRMAAFLAALLWMVNTSQALSLGWTSAYNQPLCALFMLGAFHCLLRWLETGERRYWRLQWIVFLLGFGALELNVLYPALAIGYTFLRARKLAGRTLPLAAPSIVFAVVHRIATGSTSGVYQLHFGSEILRNLWTYWSWSLGPAFLTTIIPQPAWEVAAATAILTVGLLGFVAWSARQRDLLPAFLLYWYLVLVAIFLPLSQHLSEYYPFVPSAGLAMLGGYALVRAWSRPVPWKAAAVLVAAVYVAFSVPASRRSNRWIFEHARDVRKLVLGVQRAHELHPSQAILLDGVEDLLFWQGMIDHPFPLVGVYDAYLTPGSERRIPQRPALGDVMEFIMPAGPTWHALMHEEAVVYSVRGDRLRNITTLYGRTLPTEWEHLLPLRVDAANLAEAYLLQPEWHRIEGNHRWMARRAGVQLAGPSRAGSRLHLEGAAGPKATRIAVAVNGVRLGEKPITPDENFEIELEAPAEAVGKARVTVELEVDRTAAIGADERQLGAAFGIIEFR